MRIINLASGTQIEIWDEGTRITLSGGQVIEGRPHNTRSYHQTAHDLGYGDDTLSMCIDHDPLHALVCDWLGVGESISLRCAAGLREEDAVSAAEEAAVLAIQRFLRLVQTANNGSGLLT